MKRVQQGQALGRRGQEVSDEVLVAPALARMVGDEHDEVFEMPTLLLGDHVVQSWDRLRRMRQPSFGDADTDEGVRSED